MGLACVLANVANAASEPGLFPCPGAWCQGLRGWFVIVVCGVGPLARWSTGPRQPVSPSTRQPVSWVLPCFGLDLACFLGKPKLTQTGGRRERAKRRCHGRRLGGSPVAHHCRHCPRGSGGIVACGPPRFVDSLAGLRPILALIWPVFGENPANAGVSGHRGGRCWL